MTAGFELLVRGEYSIKGDDLTVEFRLYDVLNRRMMTAKRYLGRTKDLRYFSHSFADEILLVVTGEKGCFTTHIAFVSNHSGNKEIVIIRMGRPQSAAVDAQRIDQPQSGLLARRPRNTFYVL